MITVRQASEKDNPRILKILKELDLYYPALSLTDFWVAEKAGQIVGAVQLKEYDDFIFLGSLGVTVDQQRHGLARDLLNKALKDHGKDIYLYTIIPEFFKKFGFEITLPLPNLPTKDNYQCADCHSERCVTMVKHAA